MNEILAPRSSRETTVDWDRLRPVLDDAMRELNDRDREAVLLRYFAQRPFADIGAALHLSEDAARMRVERALEKLYTLLARRGITSTSAALAVALTNHAVAIAPASLAAAVSASAVAGASAGGSAVLAAKVLNFMSMSKTMGGLAALVAAVGIGGAVYQGQKAERTAAELAALRLRHGAAMAKAREMEGKLQMTEQSSETAAARLAAAEKELSAFRQGMANAIAPPESAKANSVAGTWGDPAYARLEVEKFRTALALRYGPLYRALQLSPEQIAKFESALTEAQQGVIDIWTVAQTQGLSPFNGAPTSTSVARMTSGPLGTAEETVKRLLGNEGYEKYREYDKVRATREIVASFAGSIYFSETPLTAPQGEALAAILNANTRKVKTPMPDDGGKTLHLVADVTDWETTLTQAQGILSASQLAALRTLMRHSRIEQEMTRMLTVPEAATGKSPGG